MNYLKSILPCLAAALLAFLPGAAFALSDNLSDTGGPRTIIEASPASITIDAGDSVQVSYKITGTTTIDLDKTPIHASDLQAGMTAIITLSDDGKSATAIHAFPAPRTTKKPVKDSTTVWIMH
jgi:hypothetical protein